MKKHLALILVLLLIATNSFAEFDVTKPADDELIPTAPSVIRSNFDAFDDALVEYRGQVIKYNTASTITVTSGGVGCSDGSTTKYRGNTSSTTVTWSDLDTGGEGNGTYYVYAVCDSAATTNTYKISLSPTEPGSSTHYRRLGTFTNTSGDIVESTMLNDRDVRTTFGFGSGSISNGGTISLPSGYSQSQCVWTVSLRTITKTDDQHATNMHNENISASSSRVVTVSDSYGNVTGITANYLIVCAK